MTHPKVLMTYANPCLLPSNGIKMLWDGILEMRLSAIRIPIRWQCHITNAQAMSIDKAWIARIKEVVGWCLDNDLKVIINAHHEKWLESLPYYANQDENCKSLRSSG